MPETPGTSVLITIDPSIHTEKADRTVKQSDPVASSTYDPFVGIEAGRTNVAPPQTTSGGGGNDSLSL